VHFFFMREVVDAAAGRARGRAPGQLAGEKDAELAQKLVQLQPFLAVFPQECEGQLASSGPTEHLPRCQCAGASWSPVAAALGCGDAKPARLRIGNISWGPKKYSLLHSISCPNIHVYSMSATCMTLYKVYTNICM
jgi:hypothetical protein